MVKRLTMLMGGLILSTGIALAQTTVTGKVVSQEDGEPVIGASVRIVGTKTGTATDVDGNFTLPNASKDAVLEISYLGIPTLRFPTSPSRQMREEVRHKPWHLLLPDSHTVPDNDKPGSDHHKS